ncbi:MAG: hypothetical protein F6K13_21430 [Okeania sp. SIO2B9]|nr:hypothetical protein [Okeania sp. SIO2B9]
MNDRSVIPKSDLNICFRGLADHEILVPIFDDYSFVSTKVFSEILLA